MSLRQKLIEALNKKYDADIAQAESTVDIYLDNPVGIGEHPQHLEEMDKLLGDISEANDKIEALEEYFISSALLTSVNNKGASLKLSGLYNSIIIFSEY